MTWLERLLCFLVRHDWVNVPAGQAGGGYRFCVNCDREETLT